MKSDASPPPLSPSWSDIPEHFYKYRPLSGDGLEWLLRTIERREVFWPAPSAFNDPFDCAPRYLPPTGAIRKKVVTRVANDVGAGLPRNERRNLRRSLQRTNRADMEAAIQAGMPEVMNQTAVYSLTTDPANILMWSHYADSHAGVCIRLQGVPLFRQFAVGHWVTYEDERPCVRVGAETEQSLLRKILFTKARGWDYEDEWRLVHYKGQPGVRILNPDILDGIIFGSRISRANEDAIRTAIAGTGSNIELLKAVEDTDHYKLNVGRIS